MGGMDRPEPPVATMFRRAVVLKYTPTLKFLFDDSVVRGNKVMQIIEELEKSNPNETPS